MPLRDGYMVFSLAFCSFAWPNGLAQRWIPFVLWSDSEGEPLNAETPKSEIVNFESALKDRFLSSCQIRVSVAGQLRWARGEVPLRVCRFIKGDAPLLSALVSLSLHQGRITVGRKRSDGMETVCRGASPNANISNHGWDLSP